MGALRRSGIWFVGVWLLLQPPVEKAADGKWVIRDDKPIEDGWSSPLNGFETREECESFRKSEAQQPVESETDPEMRALDRALAKARCVPSKEVRRDSTDRH
jgi:hypothetical protein